jgi:hypothetical protein
MAGPKTMIKETTIASLLFIIVLKFPLFYVYLVYILQPIFLQVDKFPESRI